MKKFIGVSVVYFAIWGMTQASEDFWSRGEESEVTLGKDKTVSETKFTKPTTLPSPNVSDKYCLPELAEPKQMIDSMKSLFPNGKLPNIQNLQEFQRFSKQLEGAHQKSAPSIQHCVAGDWISVGDKYMALELCDFESTPAGASGLGICRYRGSARVGRRK